MRPINRILCPVDLSDVSQQAIDHAVVMARWHNAAITALHVTNPIVIPSTDFAVVGYGPSVALTDDEIKEARQRVVDCFSAYQPIAVDVVIDSGHPAQRILERAAAWPADLIVIGTHGHGGFERLVLGSVTEKLLRKATCPVMTVPPRAHTTSQLPFKRLLCPVDFSPSSLAALDCAFSLAKEGDAELTMLHVFEWLPEGEPLPDRHFAVPEYRREIEHEYGKKLQALVPGSAANWCRPTTRIAHGKAYREILTAASQDGADLIVMGVHGGNALDAMLFGSTTNQVVRRATCPVLTLR
jgi:nucleotide-binding universal stress UspA family protein